MIHVETVLGGFEVEMAVHKQRADMCNKTLTSIDHWGPFVIKARTHHELCSCRTVWGSVSWMQMVTSGKETLGQVITPPPIGEIFEQIGATNWGTFKQVFSTLVGNTASH